MLDFGHMRELKEVESLDPFLKQVLLETKCSAIHLVQVDGTVICGASATNKARPSPCLTKSKSDAIFAFWKNSTAPVSALETTCSSGHPLLALPIGDKNCIDGTLTACPFTEDKRSFLTKISDLIGQHLKLARSAVGQWERCSMASSVQDELYAKTENLSKSEEISQTILSVLMTYIKADLAILVARKAGGTGWANPCILSGSDLSPDIPNQVSNLMTTMHDVGNRPLRVGAEELEKYPQLKERGISSFISTTASYEGETLGLLMFCTIGPENPLSFDDLVLLESLKSTINLRLYVSRNSHFKREFLGHSFHRFKSPVHSIAAVTEKLSAGRESFHREYHEWIDLLESEVQRLIRLQEKVAKYSRFNNSSRERKRVSLKEIVIERTRLFQLRTEKRNVKVQVKTSSENAYVVADDEGLREALECLLDNALRVSKSGQTIHVECTALASKCQINIKDEGPGVPDIHREKIFEEFVSISHDAAMHESTGLGLALARKIIESHYGTLDYENTPENSGACFRMTLPRHENHTQPKEVTDGHG